MLSVLLSEYVWLIFSLFTLSRIGNAISENKHGTRNCSADFYDQKTGYITSPNYPSNYGLHDHCIWTIAVEPEYKVHIYFTTFALEDNISCDKASVEVRTPNSSEKFCGTRSSFNLTSFGVTVIEFKSKTNQTCPGFAAHFKVEQTEQRSVLDRKKNYSEGQCNCGHSGSQNKRIVGGTVMEANKYPWLVVLVRRYDKTSPYCGATLITTKHVITAAHCVHMHHNSFFLAIIATYRMDPPDHWAQERDIKRIFVHEKYSQLTETNDIALMELTKPVNLGESVKVICMPEAGNLFVGEIAVASGWGRVSYNGKSSPLPREVRFPVVDQATCKKAFSSTNAKITDGMLCAGVTDGSKDACQGDSGGPLIWEDSNGCYRLIGITSYGVKCAEPGYYGVYTRITHYLEWIKYVMRKRFGAKEKLCF